MFRPNERFSDVWMKLYILILIFSLFFNLNKWKSESHKDLNAGGEVFVINGQGGTVKFTAHQGGFTGKIIIKAALKNMLQAFKLYWLARFMLIFSFSK